MLTTSKPQIEDIQAKVIQELQQVRSLLEKAQKNLSSDRSAEKYAEFQQEVAEAVRNVLDLELRMAIVAPMKAGKSTIVNAIAAQEILPTRLNEML